MNYFALPGLQKGIKLPNTKEEKMNDIFMRVCRHYRVDHEVILKTYKCRKRKYVEVRQVTMYLFLRDIKGISFREAGWFFNKDEATTHHAKRAVKNLMNTNKFFRNKVESLL